jgi:hypothetical protein
MSAKLTAATFFMMADIFYKKKMYKLNKNTAPGKGILSWQP